MRSVRSLAMMFGLGIVVGCVSSGPPAPAQPPMVPIAGDSAATAPVVVRPESCFMPLMLDRTDTRMGTTVYFDRVPTAAEVHDLWTVAGLTTVVLALNEWPREFEKLQGLERIPGGTTLLIVLRGYPPNASSIDVWSYLSVPARVIVVLDGPPKNQGLIADLNAMRQLERVIVEMEYPSRSGLERLQRPLSFRVVR